jgi:hypothetical protein
MTNRIAILRCQMISPADAREIKKPGGENESSSRVEVMGWNYEKLP